MVKHKVNFLVRQIRTQSETNRFIKKRVFRIIFLPFASALRFSTWARNRNERYFYCLTVSLLQWSTPNGNWAEIIVECRFIASKNRRVFAEKLLLNGELMMDWCAKWFPFFVAHVHLLFTCNLLAGDSFLFLCCCFFFLFSFLVCSVAPHLTMSAQCHTVHRSHTHIYWLIIISHLFEAKYEPDHRKKHAAAEQKPGTKLMNHFIGIMRNGNQFSCDTRFYWRRNIANAP